MADDAPTFETSAATEQEEPWPEAEGESGVLDAIADTMVDTSAEPSEADPGTDVLGTVTDDQAGASEADPTAASEADPAAAAPNPPAANPSGVLAGAAAAATPADSGAAKAKVKKIPGQATTGKTIQLLQLKDDHTFHLNDAELSAFLLAPDVKDLKVVIVSVAGAFRKGKSFLLDFFLRYLMAKGEQDWMGPDDIPLKGFSWKGGSDRDTSGVMMWGEIFKVKMKDGETVGVIVMDTQGSFDSESTVRQCATIFALSTMTSSVQVYNLGQNLQEDDLQHLQLFTEYGRLAIDEGQCDGAPFQKLVFLIRDWCFPYDADYGYEGGQELLDRRLQVSPKQHPELQQLRQHIRSCFDSIECFLMPHPGLVVASSPNFDGKTKDINDEFLQHLKVFVPSLLGPENLVKKSINGNNVTCKELLEYIRAYVKIFGSNELPEPKSILSATAEANNLAAVAVSKDYYTTEMDTICGGDQGYVPPEELTAKHNEASEAAKKMFEGTRKMGSPEFCEKFLQKLMEDIQDSYTNYQKQNEGKNLMAALRTPMYLAIGIVGLYSASTFFSMFSINVASQLCTMLLGVLTLAGATWGYVQYSGNYRHLGKNIERGALCLWDNCLLPLRGILGDVGNPQDLLDQVTSPALNLMENAYERASILGSQGVDAVKKQL